MQLPNARTIIDRFGLQPHPEGGWFAETWRGPPGADGRSVGTAILFLLQAGEHSHWHHVDATEHWIFNAGAPLLLQLSADGCSITDHRLGPEPWSGHRPHVRVEPGVWQGAQSLGDWSLVTCTVSPGFDFAGFTLAPPHWAPQPGTGGPR